jgi:2-polyprenyl-6-methoxyphenol hydroxylase-like FAD-dependent oxidoreductase
MTILLVGSGVIGTVYGAHLAAAGHPVSVLATRPGRRTWGGPGWSRTTCSAAAGPRLR